MEDGTLLCKAFYGTVPGSTQKISTVAAALEEMGADKLYSKSYYCSGEYLNATGDIIKCHNPDGHGEQGVTKALANSCNSFFAQLVADRDLPLDAIERTYINMGYSVNGSKAGRIEVDGINSFKASTTLTDQDDFNTQWGCMGQGETLVSPCQSMMWMSAIANKDGRMTQPHFIRYSTDVFGSVKNEATVSYSDSVFSSQTASNNCSDETTFPCLSHKYHKSLNSVGVKAMGWSYSVQICVSLQTYNPFLSYTSDSFELYSLKRRSCVFTLAVNSNGENGLVI
jgi:cell division protein FtsI/penicillin-binding protein 2